MLCQQNPQLLKHDWAVELVKLFSGKADKNGRTALISVFIRNAEKTDFNSTGFKLLWEKEKNLNENELKKQMRCQI